MTSILYLHSSSDLYGSDRSLLRTIHGLDQNRYRAVVFLPYEGPLVPALREIGAEVIVCRLGIMRRSVFTPWGVLGFALDVLRALWRIRKSLTVYKITLIHSNTTAVIVGGIAARIFGVRHLWHVREIVLQPALVRRFIAWIVLHGATKVIGVSTSVIDNLARDQPSIRSKSVVLHNGIDARNFLGGDRGLIRRSFTLRENEILVGMIGRVGIWKGQELFLEVARRILAANGQGYRFVAVGGAFGPDRGKLRALRAAAATPDLHHRFLIEEFRPDVTEVLAGIDIFVQPSLLPDPFPTTVLEAMAAGKAIVANAHGGVVEMLEDGISGFLVPPNDAAALSERILTLGKDAGLRSHMGEAARTRVREMFSVTRYLEGVEALYEASGGVQSG